MVDGMEEGEQGVFGFRYRLLPRGKLAVWYRFGEHLEVGPVELERDAADELGELLERASALVIRARRYAPTDDLASPREAGERDDEDGHRIHTDPSALRRPR